VIVTGKWNTSTAAFANVTTERQSFDAWGERRAADTQVNYRATDGDAFRTSAQEHHRGYTGHEQLDDSGLIHMNGRIYDPELGRFLSPDPYVQIPEYSQNFNRYSYVLNNPLNATDPSGFSFLSKFFSKVGSWIKENWRTVVTVVFSIVVGAVTGALAGAWATALNFAPAVSAGIGAGVGTFWSSLTSSLLSGAGIKNSISGAIKSGIIAAVATFAFYRGLETLVDMTNPNQEATLYRVDGETSTPTKVNIDEVKNGTLSGIPFINGMNNDLGQAITNGAARVGPGKDFYLAYNPTNGALADFLECGLDKLGGSSNISRSTSHILSKFNPASTQIYAHSQGTMIATNALSILSKSQSTTGFKLYAWGSAQNELSARLLLNPHGIQVAPMVNHPLDAVANIVGYNALIKPNPYRVISSFLASPLLFTGWKTSPHGPPQGGVYLKYFPWIYDN
jgi:RHS repeat-associated protein